MNAQEAFRKLKEYKFHTVLDVGSGDGQHAKAFKKMGKEVTTVSYIPEADHIGDFLEYNLGCYDCVWCSHVLEHQLNVNLFLLHCAMHLKDGGILAITVPPLKKEIVGGHLTLWNAGLLLYNLIVAGFDCSKACVKTYGYNISVIVKKKTIAGSELQGLVYDNGDIERLARFFPMNVNQGFNGDITEVNWIK